MEICRWKKENFPTQLLIISPSSCGSSHREPCAFLSRKVNKLVVLNLKLFKWVSTKSWKSKLEVNLRARLRDDIYFFYWSCWWYHQIFMRDKSYDDKSSNRKSSNPIVDIIELSSSFNRGTAASHLIASTFVSKENSNVNFRKKRVNTNT